MPDVALQRHDCEPIAYLFIEGDLLPVQALVFLVDRLGLLVQSLHLLPAWGEAIKTHDKTRTSEGRLTKLA